MKRLVVFCIYDSDGYVDRSTIFIIRELKTVSQEIIVVVNGILKIEFKNELEMLADKLILRDNSGFDAGAYADVIVNYLGFNSLSSYDELILCNDTFFGPLVSFKKIFNEMSLRKNDFWGIDIIRRNLFSYIIMYFCVFRKDVIKDRRLFEYFEKNVYERIHDIHDAFAVFEVGLFKYLLSCGYKEDSYASTCGLRAPGSPYECITKYELPIVKKRFFSPDFYDVHEETRLQKYIESNTTYDYRMINNYVKRKYNSIYVNSIHKTNKSYSCPNVGEEAIIEFINKHKKICIWGYGSFARAIYFIFKSRIKSFGGFIVSNIIENVTYRDYVTTLENVDNKSGIIVAMNKKNTLEVIKRLKGYIYITFW